MLELVQEFVLKILSKITPIFAKWLYDSKKFDEAIKIRVRSEGDGITYNCGELPNIRIWLSLTNLNPFEIVIDRIYGQISHACIIGNLVYLKRQTIPARQEREIFLELFLNEHQQRHIKLHQNINETTLYLSAYVESSLHALELSKTVSTHHARFINCTA